MIPLFLVFFFFFFQQLLSSRGYDHKWSLSLIQIPCNLKKGSRLLDSTLRDIFEKNALRRFTLIARFSRIFLISQPFLTFPSFGSASFIFLLRYTFERNFPLLRRAIFSIHLSLEINLSGKIISRKKKENTRDGENIKFKTFTKPFVLRPLPACCNRIKYKNNREKRNLPEMRQLSQ